MFDWDDIVNLAPVALVMAWAALKWIRRAQRRSSDMPGPESGESYEPTSSKRGEIDFERDYEPLEPR